MISTVTLNPTVDKTVYVTRLSPNDTNRVLRVETDAGGKGINCSRMLKRLGCDTRVITFIGGNTGDFVRAILERECIQADCITIAKPTRTCICVEESAGAAPTTFNERGGPIEHNELVSLFEKTKDAAQHSSYMVFGGSVPVGINQDVYKVLVQSLWRAARKPCWMPTARLLAKASRQSRL